MLLRIFQLSFVLILASCAVTTPDGVVHPQGQNGNMYMLTNIPLPSDFVEHSSHATAHFLKDVGTMTTVSAIVPDSRFWKPKLIYSAGVDFESIFRFYDAELANRGFTKVGAVEFGQGYKYNSDKNELAISYSQTPDITLIFVVTPLKK